MAIRVSGLISGLDTDSIVQELVSAYAVKKDSYVKKQTLQEWKMDAWSDLNKKVNSLYKKLGNLKLSSAYNKKVTTCSDTTKATISATSSAINGTQSLKINQVAKTAYITGAKLDDSVTGSTKLSDLGVTGDSNIAVTTSSGTKNVTLTADMTVNQVVTALKDAGVSANYDSTNKRMFISATASGVENDFSLTGTDANGIQALQSLGIYVAKDSNTAAYQKWADYAEYAADGAIDEAATKAKLTEILETIGRYQAEADEPDSIKALEQDSANRKTENTNLLNKVNYANSYSALKEALSAEYTVKDDDGNVVQDAGGNDVTTRLSEAEQTEMWELMTKYELDETEQARLDELKANLGVDDETWKEMESSASVVKKFDAYLLTDTLTSEERTELQEVQDKVRAAYEPGGNGAEDIKGLVGSAETTEDGTKTYTGWTGQIAANNDAISANTEAIAEKNAYISSYSFLTNAAPATDTTTTDDRVQALMDKINFATQQLDPSSAAAYSTGATVIAAQDAEIELNGVVYTSSSSNITVNGLTITALQVTNGEEITISTQDDVQGMYDTIKDFLTQYNELIKEMTELYNADSAKGYEPLTDEEKDAMTDTEIEKWEQKIKDALLRRDGNLSSVMSLMTTAMSQSITLSNGKSYSLSSFGISTQGYLAAEENEESVYHIDGDPDDEITSGKTDKLMAAIQEDPDVVVEFFQKLTSNFYDKLNDKMGSSTTTHSIYTIYNDKTMQNEYDDYTDMIKKWEEKLADLEDYYYSKFAAMETALSNLQNQQSALSGLLGS